MLSCKNIASNGSTFSLSLVHIHSWKVTFSMLLISLEKLNLSPMKWLGMDKLLSAARFVQPDQDGSTSVESPQAYTQRERGHFLTPFVCAGRLLTGWKVACSVKSGGVRLLSTREKAAFHLESRQPAETSRIRKRHPFLVGVIPPLKSPWARRTYSRYIVNFVIILSSGNLVFYLLYFCFSCCLFAVWQSPRARRRLLICGRSPAMLKKSSKLKPGIFLKPWQEMIQAKVYLHQIPISNS